MTDRTAGPLAPWQFEILLSLVDGPMHGYGIIRDIETRSQGRLSPSTSTLYGGIRQLLRDGLLEDAGSQTDATSGGPARRYYRVTDVGLAAARAEAERLREAARTAVRRLDGLAPEHGRD